MAVDVVIYFRRLGQVRTAPSESGLTIPPVAFSCEHSLMIQSGYQMIVAM